MNIGEMFVKIGVKDSDKSVKDIKSVKTAMGDLKDMSLQTKVALAAAAYGLEQITAKAMSWGSATTRFAAETGINRKFFEDITWGMKKFGVSTEETEATLRGLQSRIQDIRMGAGTSGLFSTFASVTHLDQNRMTDMPYMMNKLKEYEKMPDSFDKQKFFGALGAAPGFMAGLHLMNQSGKGLDFEHLNRSDIGMGEKEALGALKSKARWGMALRSLK